MKTSRRGQIRATRSSKNDPEVEELEQEVDVDHDADVFNIINAMFEVKKKQGKPTDRTGFHKKKLEKYNAAHAQGGAMVRDTLTFLDELKTTMEDMKGQEISVDKSLQDLNSFLNHREEKGRSLLKEFIPIVDALSPQRAAAVNDASASIEESIAAREESRKKTLRTARESLAEGLEQHRLAIDAVDLIKHYKVLVRS